MLCPPKARNRFDRVIGGHIQPRFLERTPLICVIICSVRLQRLQAVVQDGQTTWTGRLWHRLFGHAHSRRSTGGDQVRRQTSCARMGTGM